MSGPGRTVVVAGAAGALGRAVASACVAAGMQVLGIDRRVPAAGVDGVAYSAVDVADDRALGAWFTAAPTPWAVLDVVGGFAPHTPLADLDGEQLMAQLRLNLLSAALVTKHALRRMAAPGEGRIVLTASRAALRPEGSGFAYSVSKLGVLHLVEAAARETHGTAITVNAVVPSIIDTPANRAAMPGADPTGWPTPAELAELYVLLASPGTALVSGAAVPAYGRA